MKRILTIVLIIAGFSASAQVYQRMPQYGYQMPRAIMDSVLQPPTDTVRNKTGLARIGSVLYAGNGTSWSTATIDTTGIRYRPTAGSGISITGSYPSQTIAANPDTLVAGAGITLTASGTKKVTIAANTANLDSLYGGKLDSVRLRGSTLREFARGDSTLIGTVSGGGGGTLQEAFDAAPTANPQINARGNVLLIDSISSSNGAVLKTHQPTLTTEIGFYSDAAPGLKSNDIIGNSSEFLIEGPGGNLIYAGRNASTSSNYYMNAGPSAFEYYRYTDALDSMRFTFSAAEKRMLLIGKHDNSDDVRMGIGTSDPTTTLHVVGGIKADSLQLGGGAWITSIGGGSGITTAQLTDSINAREPRYKFRNDSTGNSGYTTLFQRNKLKDSIQANIDLKANTASPTFTGTVTTPMLQVTGRTSLQGVTVNKDSLPISTTNRWAVTIDTPTNRLQRYDLNAKLNISDSPLLRRQSIIFPTRSGYLIYPQVNAASSRPLEIMNLGATALTGSSFQQAPTGLVKNNWSQIGTWNMTWDSANTRWLQAQNIGAGATAYEAGAEGITLHAVASVNYPLFNGTWHEGFQTRMSGVDGLTGLTSGQYNQSKFPLFIAYRSGTYTDDTHPWAGGTTRQDTAMIWLQSNEVKGTTGEFMRFEQNSASASGGQLFFRKSRGSYASKTAANSGDNAGVISFSQHDGTNYETTARILSFADSAANTDRVPQSLAFQTSPNTLTNIATRLRIYNNGQITVGSSAPATGSILDVQSTTAALVVPRMTTAQRDAIASPVAGAIIYCTDCTATDASTGVSQTYNGSTWKNHY